MLTAARVAFCFCVIGVFEQTVSWTIDLPQVRKYFFEKSLQDREKNDPRMQLNEKVFYDNINTHSLHTEYDKYREHYADEYKYHGYMEQKVHDAVRNGSAYLEGLRRAIEDYSRRLETCRRLPVTANIIQFRPDILNLTTANATGTVINLTSGNLTNLPIDPSNPPEILANLASGNLSLGNPLPTNATGQSAFVAVLNTNFTEFLRSFSNYTMFNMSAEMEDCVRADMASEHVRRLAQLAVWAASELQDKLYEEKYSEHEHSEGAHHDDSLVLRLAWFLDRLAHLTGYQPRPEEFLPQDRASGPSNAPPPPPTLAATAVSPEDMQRLTTCLRARGGDAPERCAWTGNVSDTARLRWPGTAYIGISTAPPDLRPSASEDQEYTYSEQVFTDDDMPLSLPQRKAKRSIPKDPLRELATYYAKYKAWTGSNQDLKPSESQSDSGDSNLIRPKRFIVKEPKYLRPVNPFQDLSGVVKHKSGVHINKDEKEAKALKKFVEGLKKPMTKTNLKRPKRFIVKKLKHLKPSPFPDLGSIVKHKLEVHVKKDEKEGKVKKFLEKLHVRPKTEVKVLKLKKHKRSVKYSKKVQPRVPVNPQGDISYYVKNKAGRSYSYNVAQAAAVRASLEQAFQTGNILVVQRYGSNYNPANRMQISNGYAEGFSDI